MTFRFAGLLVCVAACRPSGSAPADAAPPAPTSVASAAPSAVSSVSAAAVLGSSTRADAGVLRARSQAKSGETLEIPAGTFPGGSTPGDEGRDPTIEPAGVDVTLTAFSIDALPYPNVSGEPPKTNVSQADATRLCGERGARLCSELEWERACKGPANDLYATGSAWDTACDAEPAACSSGFGVRAMGTIREWTKSEIASGEGASSPALRGAGALRTEAGAPPAGVHRCARRSRGDRERGDVGFRCCKGPENPGAIAAIEARPGFRKPKIDAHDLAKIFATLPELARLGADIRLYEQGDVNSVTGRSTASREEITFTPQPVLWSPEPGAELLVATGRGKSMSFVVALYPLPNDRYRVASYFFMQNDLSPVVLAYSPTRRRELLWTSCWGCAGEQGSVSVRDDHHVVIVQH